MDLRSGIQLLSCFVVAMILFYQFELAPKVVVTWVDKNQENDNFQNELDMIQNEVNQPIDDYYDTELNDIEEIEYNANIQNKISSETEIIEIINNNDQNENQQVSEDKINIDVSLPSVISECSQAIINLRSKNSLKYAERISIMNDIYVEVTCSHAENPLIEFTKYLPVIPGKNGDNMNFFSSFFPDKSSGHCGLAVKVKSSDIVLFGSTNNDYIVQEIPANRPYCWTCASHIYRDVPLAYQFLLMDDDGIYLFGKTKMSLGRHEQLVLWIVPHPLIKEQYPDIVPHLLFNAFLKSETIIQNVDVSRDYNEEKGGYQIIIIGKDADDLALFVMLNWIYPYSEIRTDDPEPILVGSHIDHGVSVCDFERSEIYDSQFIITVESRTKYITPVPPRKCDCSLEEGRWLVPLPLEAECRPPFCTGDRNSSFINSMSWQGTRYDTIWVPYECHYHYYTPEDFAYCANEKNIKWIHVMGDSLPREFVAYLMSFNNILDTSKFDHADVILGNSGIRLTFESWVDILLQPEDYDGPRNVQYIQEMIDHFNLREEHTSGKVSNPEYYTYLNKEETSPDVFILNPANAYCLYKQSKENYQRFVEDFTNYCGDAFINGRKGDGKKTKVFWYGNPYLHGTAHAGTEFVTQTRNEQFNEITKPIVEDIGIRFFDSHHVTKSRPSESWDGLHYIRGYERWTGHVASTFIQNFLNELFGDCTGPNPINN